MSHLITITSTCVPRPDPIYGDPTEFFNLTYPTAGLQDLLTRTFGRLTGAKVPGAEHGLIRSETSFGGGKTHGLMAVYHLARGARPLNVGEFVDPALLPDTCRVAGIVADTLDPLNGLETNGVRTHTLWGEMAAQLGPDAYEALRQSDEERTAPGKVVLAEAIGNTPTVVIIDEIAQHLRQLTSSGNEDTRRLAKAVPVFLKNLLEVAASTPTLVVIITLATRQDAYGDETEELTAALAAAEADAEAAEAAGEAGSVVARFTQGGSIIKPAEDTEIAEILKRRLFASIDPAAATAAADAYRAFYDQLIANGEQLTGGAEQTGTYAAAIEASYPFHPELVRVLDQRLGTIPNFQRARGALKLLAEVVAGIWTSGTSTEIINVADIDYDRPEVLHHLTIGLGRAEFDNVAKADFVGPSSHAAEVDDTRFDGRSPITKRACRTVFTHSLEMVNAAGAGRPEVMLGTLAVGDSPDLVSEALGALDQSAWFLEYNSLRWRFSTEPNANNIIFEATRNIANTAVNQELRTRITEAFPSDGSVTAIHFPSGPASVPDAAKLRLVVLHHDDLAVRTNTAQPAPSAVVELLDKAGAAEGHRRYRNAVAFLVADADAIAALADKVRFELAATAVAKDTTRMSEFTPEVRTKVTAIADSAKLNARVALTRCYRHLYLPWTDKSNDYLRHEELPTSEQGKVAQAQTKVIVEQLTEIGKVRTTAMSTDYLRSRAWPPASDEVTTASLAEAFWEDHGASIILDVTILRDAIREGVRNGSWIYWDTTTEKAWTANDPAPQVQIGSEFVLYTPDKAKELGLLGRAVRIDDITAALLLPQTTGADLRSALEAAIGREPTKTEVLDVLARAAEGGEEAKVVVVAGEVEAGAKALTPSDIRGKIGLDSVTILTTDEADRLSIARPGSRRTNKTVEGKGAIGVAFQAMVDQATDTTGTDGFTLIEIVASADPGEGVRDLVALAQAAPMLPKFQLAITCEVAMDFDGLSDGAEIRLSGPAASFQKVEDALFALGKKASVVAGTLHLQITFDDPVATDAKEIEDLRKVVGNLRPGEVKVRGVLR
jgi:hypothetical protein